MVVAVEVDHPPDLAAEAEAVVVPVTAHLLTEIHSTATEATDTVVAS